MSSLIIKNTILKIIFYCCLSILTVAHLLKGFSSGFELNQSSVIIFVLFFIAILKEKRELYFLTFCLQGVFTILTLEILSNLTPAIMFFVGLLYLNKTINLYIISVLLITSFLGVSYINESSTISQVLEGLVVNLGLLTFLYFAVIKKPKKKIDLWSEISEKEKSVLSLYSKGNDYSQICDQLKIKDKKESIRTSITRMRDKTECKNDIQFGIWLSEKG